MSFLLQFAPKDIITKEELLQKWKGLRLPIEQLDTILALGNFSENINWMQFFALGCSALGGVSGCKYQTVYLTVH